MKYFIAIMFLVVSCGNDPSGHEKEPKPIPKPKPDPWSVEIQGLVKEQCALSGCHAGAGFLRTGASFKASNSLRRIQSGNMPKKSSPNYGLYNDAKKRTFIDYLSGA